MANWLEYEDITFDEVVGFMGAACDVLRTMQEVDFRLFRNGDELKKQCQTSVSGL